MRIRRTKCAEEVKDEQTKNGNGEGDGIDGEGREDVGGGEQEGGGVQ